MATDSTYLNGVSNHVSTRATPNNVTAQVANQDGSHTVEEVGWYFVESYYNTMSKASDKLYLFFKDKSQFAAGVEEEKVKVYIGQKSIGDRIKELDLESCKVRVTNVDTQSTDKSIVVQVIGEMSNKGEPSRKFVQTFILAPQPNGWYVLNDIFRYIAEEDDETADEAVEANEPIEVHEDTATVTELEAAPVKEFHPEPVDIDQLDKKLEVDADEDEPEQVNGHAEETASVDDASEAPEAEKEPETAKAVAEDVAQPETAKAPAPAPAPVEQKPASKPAGPTKPALPKTWAQLASANAASSAAARAGSNQAAAQPKAAVAPVPAPAPAATTAAVAATSSPQRQPSPDSNKEGSNGGWQSVGNDHSRTKSKSHATPFLTDNGTVRAYVKNVFQSVTNEALEAELAKYGKLSYFDVSRQKNSAFVEFENIQGFQGAVANNPHRIGGHEVVVEERRPSAFPPRGNIRGGPGGRGGLDNRQGPGRGAFRGDGPPRGGFGGNRGRGGPTNTIPARGGRPQQAV